MNRLKKIYYDASHPAGFAGAAKLSTASGISLDKTKRWLSSQRAHTLHKPVRRKFVTRPYLVNHIDQQWQADLIDVHEYSRWNDGATFLLTIIDIFSRYAWAVALRSKSAEAVAEAYESIFAQGRVPEKIQTDLGREFSNTKVRAVFERYGVTHFASLNKAYVCERFNKTLQIKTHKYMTARGTMKYVDKLEAFVNSYNASRHRTIGMAPRSVTKQLTDRVMKSTYGKGHRYMLGKSAVTESGRAHFRVGDYVRTSHSKELFKKGYKSGWTNEIFRIRARLLTNPPTYLLEDVNGEVITGGYYEEELQKVRLQPGKLFGQVLEARVRKDGKKELLLAKGKRKRWETETKLA